MLCLSNSIQSTPLDIMISHDWPQGIEQHGDTQGLIRRKPYFQREIQQNCLGSPPNNEMLRALKPKWWFAAHLHVKFRAQLVHGKTEQGSMPNSGASLSQKAQVTDLVPSSAIQADTRKRKAEEVPIVVEDSKQSTRMESPQSKSLEGEESTPEPPKSDKEVTQFVAPQQSDQSCGNIPDLTDQMTQFLSLDKCLPRRHFLTVVDIPVTERIDNPKLEYDLDWLAILRKTHHLSTSSPHNVELPNELAVIDETDRDWLRERIGSLDIPNNFTQTVPPISHGNVVDPVPRILPPPIPLMGNPQTDHLLQLLQLDHIITVPFADSSSPPIVISEPPPCESSAPLPVEDVVEDGNEIDLDDADE